MINRDHILQRFHIILEPDLSTASLHVISTFELTRYEFEYIIFDDYRICEDVLVSCRISSDLLHHYANIISHGGPVAKILLPDIAHHYRAFSCPPSGRFVLLSSSNTSRVVVLDFF